MEREVVVAEIVLEDLGKIYPDGTRAVGDVTLTIADAEFLVLVGPSGCGKSTILRMIAGLEEISEGKMYIGDRLVNDVQPKDRDIAMVFQNYALYPHMSVYDNMAFGLKLRKMPKEEIKVRVEEAAEVLEITDFLQRKPKALSGGQRQRVAMGRAIVREPKAFLMDEPLSNLDAKLRVQMRAEISRLQRNLGITTIYVTHDQVEAMTIGDRAAIIRGGVLQQVDTPQHLYQKPANLFVAAFIGSPGMNLLEAAVRDSGGRLCVDLAGWSLPLPGETLTRRPALRTYEGRRIAIGIRPEDVEDAALVVDSDPAHQLESVVDLREDLGSHVLAYLTVTAPSVVPDEMRDLASEPGTTAIRTRGQIADEGQSVFLAQLSARTAAKEGQRVRVSVDPSRLYFFDLESGDEIYR
jgi:multiple sugar transport system ATP-binding protein